MMSKSVRSASEDARLVARSKTEVGRLWLIGQLIVGGLLMGALMVGCAASPVYAQRVSVVEPGGDVSWLGGSAVRTRIRVGADGETYVGVWVQAPEMQGPTEMRAPMAVSLIVDTSGSMAGQKIQNARMAAASLLESLRDGDQVSIYGFNNQVIELAPPTQLSQSTRSWLMQRVQSLYAAGGTNMYGGLQMGVQRLQQAPATHPLRRIFLISDGRANVGPSDPQSLGNLAAQATEWGTQVTAIGVGVDYDQQTLSALAVRSAGRLYHLSQPQQMAQILEQELSLMSRSVAVNAYLEVIAANGVVILGGLSTGTSMQNGRLRLPLGALYAGQEREVLFRARVDTAALGSRALADARIVYERPGHSGQITQRSPITYEVVRDSASARRSAAPRVAAMVANHQATQAGLQAAEQMRQGRAAEASRTLRVAQDNLQAAAAAAPASSRSARRLRSRAQRFEGAGRAAGAAPSPAAARAQSFEMMDEALEADGY